MSEFDQGVLVGIAVTGVFVVLATAMRFWTGRNAEIFVQGFEHFWSVANALRRRRK